MMDVVNNFISKNTSLPLESTDSLLTALEVSRELALFAAVAAIILCLLGAAGNLLTIVALINDHQLRQQATTFFVISLAVSDLFFCAINLPLTAVRYIQQKWTLGPILCRLFPFFFYGNVAASLMSMVAITVNRYVLIVYHKYYRKIYSTKNIWFMLLAVWLFSFGMIFPPLVDLWGTLGLDEATFSCTIKKLNGRSPKKFLFLVAFLLPSISIIVCYSFIFRKVRSSRLKVQGHSTPQPAVKARVKAMTRGQRLEDLKLTKMMLTIFLLFLICFLPLMLVNVLDEDIKQPSFHIIASVLAWMSSTINPIIYSFLNKHYQKAFSALLCMCRSEKLPTEHKVSRSSILSCYASTSGGQTPISCQSMSSGTSINNIELKYYNHGEDFTIIPDQDMHFELGDIRRNSCCVDLEILASSV